MADKQPDEKQFSLKGTEQQMLKVLQDQYFTHLSNFLSFLSIERLAYTVTPNTKFRIEGNTLFISEDAAAADQKPPADDVATAPATTGGDK